MTVQELIDKLTLVKDKSVVVYSEGCDCSEEAGAVAQHEDSVTIRRKDSWYSTDEKDL